MVTVCEQAHFTGQVDAYIGELAVEIARLAGHSSSRTTELVYRHELRPVITTGADAMGKRFR